MDALYTAGCWIKKRCSKQFDTAASLFERRLRVRKVYPNLLYQQKDKLGYKKNETLPAYTWLCEEFLKMNCLCLVILLLLLYPVRTCGLDGTLLCTK